MNYPNLAVAPGTPTNIFLLHQFAGNNLPGDWLQTQNAVGHWHGRWGVQIGGAASDAAAPSPYRRLACPS
jgi:hypothetical protein